jgi:hypothetical protein
VSFGMDASLVPYMTENITWFVLETVTWPILAFVVWKFVNDSNYFKEQGVFAPKHILDEMQPELLNVTKINPTASHGAEIGKV